jgi:signal transduction histidine kinase
MRKLAPADDSIAWARDVIARQLRQLTRLVDDLLDVSRITRGKITCCEPLELTSVVAQAVESSRPLIDGLANSSPCVPVPWVRGDAVRLGQVLSMCQQCGEIYPRGAVSRSPWSAGIAGY